LLNGIVFKISFRYFCLSPPAMISFAYFSSRVSSTDDEAHAELELVLPVVHEAAEGQGEGQRRQLLLQHGLDAEVGVDGAPHEDVALGKVELVSERARRLAHLEIRFGVDADLEVVGALLEVGEVERAAVAQRAGHDGVVADLQSSDE